MSSIGIIGAGQIGTAIATALARKGLNATLSNRRGPDSLVDIVTALRPTITAGTREEAASKEIVFVAVNWSNLQTALAGLPDFAGRIVIDTNNPVEAPLFKPADLKGRSSSEVFAELVPGAHVVKGFNHLSAALLVADPATDGGRRVLFYSGDDARAKAETGRLIEILGFFGVDLGTLSVGARLAQFPGGPLTALNLVKID